MRDASRLLMTQAVFNRGARKGQSSSTSLKPVREGRKGKKEAGLEGKSWLIDGQKEASDSPFEIFCNKMIVLFLCFFTGLGQSGPKGTARHDVEFD